MRLYYDEKFEEYDIGLSCYAFSSRQHRKNRENIVAYLFDKPDDYPLFFDHACGKSYTYTKGMFFDNALSDYREVNK